MRRMCVFIDFWCRRGMLRAVHNSTKGGAMISHSHWECKKCGCLLTHETVDDCSYSDVTGFQEYNPEEILGRPYITNCPQCGIALNADTVLQLPVERPSRRYTAYVVERFIPKQCPKCCHLFGMEGEDYANVPQKNDGKTESESTPSGYTIIRCTKCGNLTAKVLLEECHCANRKKARALFKEGFVNLREMKVATPPWECTRHVYADLYQ
jgi:hypothetical protein